MENGKMVIVATDNQRLNKYLNKLEKDGEIIVKRAEDSVLEYFKKSQVEVENFNEEQSSSVLMSFLWLDENREQAKIKQQRLLSRLTEEFHVKGGAEETVKYNFTISQVKHATGLRNSEITDMLKLLESFGLAVFLKQHIVRLTVDEQTIEENYVNSVKLYAKRLLIEMSKYDSFVKNHDKQSKFENLKETILSIIEQK